MIIRDWLYYFKDVVNQHPFQLAVVLLVLSTFLFFFRHKIFYTSYNHLKSDDANWNKTLSFGDYIDSLLSNPQTRKLKISYDLVNNIYLTNLNDDEKISIKKMKTSTFFFRIFLQIIKRGPVWFIKHNFSELNILSKYTTPTLDEITKNNGLIFDQNHVQFQIYARDSDSHTLNEILLEAVLDNLPECKIDSTKLQNDERKVLFSKILTPIVHFVRGAGYLQHRDLISKEINWRDPIFFKTVVAIGAAIDPILFRVRIRLVQSLPNLTIPVPKPDLLIFKFYSNAFVAVEQSAKQKIDNARARLKQVKNSVQAQLSNSSKEPEPRFESPESIISSLAEVNEVEANSPEAFAQETIIAKIFLESLNALGPLSIELALNHPLVITSNKFIKVSSKKRLSELYNPLLSKITATKLGISPRAFALNPGFEDFSRKTHLHRYLYVYKQNIQCDPVSGELQLLFEGKQLKWKEICGKLRFDEDGSFLGQYSQSGLVNNGPYDWDELKPFYVEESLPPPWGDRYLCEICSWIIDKPRVTGDHTFLRLKTPTGDWYSVGQYVLFNLGYERYVFPMAIKPSKLMSPDVSEFYTGHFTTLSFEITKEQFLKMKEKIEKDKSQQLQLYQICENNCTIWAKSIAELADLDLPSSLATADILFPRLTNFGRKVNKMRYTPKWIRSIVKLLWAIFLNCATLALGSGMVHKGVKEDPVHNSAIPYIHDLKDVMNVSKAASQHPFVIGQFVRQQVESWREAKIKVLSERRDSLLLQQQLLKDGDELLSQLNERLAEIDKAIESVQYAVPDRFKRHKHNQPSENYPSSARPL